MDWASQSANNDDLDTAGIIEGSDDETQNEVDNVDWASQSANDDDLDTASIISAGTADDQSDGVDQGQQIKAAATQLKMAWNERCVCGI